MNKEEYTEKALAALKTKYTNQQFKKMDNEELLLEYCEQGKESNPLRLYLNTPFEISSQTDWQTWEAELYEYFDKASSIKIDFGDSAFEEVRNKILPQVKSKEQITTIESDVYKDATSKLVHIPYDEKLVIAYVIDQPNGFVYITEDYLEMWHISANELDKLALENLAKLPATIEGPKKLVNNEGITLYMFESGDGFDAVRFILPQLVEFLKKVFSDGFALGIPHRDLLIATSVSNKKSLQDYVVQEFERDSHPVTPELYVVNKKKGDNM